MSVRRSVRIAAKKQSENSVVKNEEIELPKKKIKIKKEPIKMIKVEKMKKKIKKEPVQASASARRVNIENNRINHDIQADHDRANEQEEIPRVVPVPGQFRDVFEMEDMPTNYAVVRPGNALLSRRLKKATLESGSDLYLLKEWTRPYSRHGRHYPPKIIGYGAPASVLADVRAGIAVDAHRIAARRESAHHREQNNILIAFDRIYPQIPAHIRDVVIQHAFKKNSGRVGRAPHLDMDTKVAFATRSWVLHEMTDYSRRFETEKDRLYEEICHDARDSGGECYAMALDEFRAAKDEVIEQLKSQYFRQVDEITAPWR